MRIAIKSLLAIIVFIITAVFFLAMYVYHSTQIQESGSVSLAKLQGKVSITRDMHGIAHIEATQDDRDAMFALGYVHAQERLYQMDFQRHVAQGRLSEWFGDKTLDIDKFMRTLGVYRAAKRDDHVGDARSLTLIHSYLDGVNSYIAQGRLPLEFTLLGSKPEPFTEADVRAWAKMMSYDLQYMWQFKVRNYNLSQQYGQKFLTQFFPKYPRSGTTTVTLADLRTQHAQTARKHTSGSEQAPVSADSVLGVNEVIDHLNDFRAVTGQGINEANGSNAWVVSGKLTESGKPMLCSDPHLALQAPSLWYLAEVKGPGLHIIGATLPGIPGVVIGHNDHIAWGLTNSPANTQDLYVLPKHAKIQVRDEVIHVKGQKDVHLSVEESAVGPVINHVYSPIQDQQDKIALRWTSLEKNDTTPTAFLELCAAKNWHDFQRGLTDFVAPTLNFFYADTAGNIGYQMAGRVPVRHGWDGRSFVPLDKKHQWAGYQALAKMPHVYNPKRGWIANANNKTTADTTASDQINFYWPVPPYRIDRIQDMLKDQIKQGKLTEREMQKIQINSQSRYALALKPYLLKAKPTNDHVAKALAELQNWQGEMTQESVPATIFNVWYAKLAQRMVNDRLKVKYKYRAVPLMILQQLKTDGALCHIDQQLTDCGTLMSETLTQTVAELDQKLGTDIDQWHWGQLHKAEFKYLGLGESELLGWFLNRHLPAPGGNFTPNMGSYDFETYHDVLGPSYRQIVDLSHFDRSYYINSLGQSGNFLSPHYADQMPVWRDGKYLPMSGDRADWGKTTVLMLVPKKAA